ncbi:hypothetical protein EHQ57_10225 [Leptospira wolffii]|uniref:hypothetical protein n=1 Tax=Leptospira wolffii TaxID=409998 RepID=UPI00108489E9|nr:hypothetical protein [Leptospira wolffii]TGK59200.1 hypothetical protein EHQ32_10415 [Leptospira wolffii]TGK71419.1 hypothetical protein EHQ35_14930 [Leptospira wolffii]TGL29304.1 hypothetical protein EHQ57_10225 [Leptospira wolffii]
MKKIKFVSLILLFFGFSILSKELPSGSIIKKINSIEYDPLGPNSKDSYRSITKFAYESSSVHVIISQKLLPWLGRDMEYKEYLLGSFIAGNVKSQILTNQKKDDSYSGILSLIRTYKYIQNINGSFRVAEIEDLIRLQESGELQKFTNLRVN